MILVDANLLLYAYNADAPQQNAAARWLEGLLESGQPVGLPWVTVWAFLRINQFPDLDQPAFRQTGIRYRAHVAGAAPNDPAVPWSAASGSTSAIGNRL